jgi:hypothetical protein
MLFWGVVCLCLSAVVFAVVLIGARDPAKPKWVAKFESAWGVLITGLLVFGAFVLFFSLAAPWGVAEVVASLVVAGATVAVLWILAPHKRIARLQLLGRETNP